jgi:hypothetical protein
VREGGELLRLVIEFTGVEVEEHRGSLAKCGVVLARLADRDGENRLCARSGHRSTAAVAEGIDRPRVARIRRLKGLRAQSLRRWRERARTRSAVSTVWAAR